MTRDELAKRIDDCEPIRKQSLAGIDLSGGAFLGGVFEEVDLTGADLERDVIERSAID